MSDTYPRFISSIYQYFNERNIDAILAMFDKNVHWPNGWEGGYVEGHDQVRNYWTRQWMELNPNVQPVEIKELPDGRIEVNVHQVVKDLKNNLVADGMVRHVYEFSNGLVKSMEINPEDNSPK